MSTSLTWASSFHRDRLSEVLFNGSNGEPLQRSRFGDFEVHDGRAYPMNIELTTYGSTPETDHFTFSNPQFGIAIPDSIISLNIPPGVEVKDMAE
jgi:hypothetical protein